MEIAAKDFQAHFKVEFGVRLAFSAELIQFQQDWQLLFAEGIAVAGPLATICSTNSRDDDCRATLAGWPSCSTLAAPLTFSPVYWVKMNAIAGAALDFVQTAVTIVLGPLGGLAPWMGLLRIAEASGIRYLLIRVTLLRLRPLFPEVFRNHLALGMIVLDMGDYKVNLTRRLNPVSTDAW